MALRAASLPAPIALSWREDRWPSRASARWALRLALSLPFIAISDLSTALGSPSQINEQLVRHAQSLTWTSGVGWVSHAYPPFTLVIAKLLPGGQATLGNAGAIFAAILIQVIIERLVLRAFSLPAAAVITATLVITPMFMYTATQDFPAFVSLCLLSVSLTRLLDFLVNRSTESGFIAGITFAIASMSDIAVPVFVAAAAVATLVVSPATRATYDIARRRAALAVVLFPSVAAIGGWIFLQWRFTGSWTADFTQQSPLLFKFPQGVWTALGSAASSVAKDLLLAPV